MIDTLRKCLHLLPRSSRRDYLLLMPLSLLTGLAEMGAAVGIFTIITVLTNPAKGLAVEWVAAISRHLPWQGQNALILELTALLATFFVVRSAVILAAQYVRIRVAHTANAALSCDMLRRYLAAEYPFHFGRHSSDLIRNCTTTVHQSLGVLSAASGLLTDGLMAAGMIAVLWATSPGLSLAASVVLTAMVLAVTEFTESIVLDAVSYSYPSAPTPAIAEVSLTIRRGESIGIIGPTGAGKSTLVDVILGLLPPSSGRVTVDGRDLGATSAPWKRRIGYVPQSIYLVDDSLQRNIALGIPDARIDTDRIHAVLAAAQLDHFVESLPAGLDTHVGERGIRLSGGERQRLAIARALYHDPDVIIFDEATASLDVQTEAEITRTITALRHVKTVVVIAHRLSSVKSCDRLVWLSAGRVVDIGSFEDLQQRRADFRALIEFAAV